MEFRASHGRYLEDGKSRKRRPALARGGKWPRRRVAGMIGGYEFRGKSESAIAQWRNTCRGASARASLYVELFVALSSSENAHRAFFRVGNAGTYRAALEENSFHSKRVSVGARERSESMQRIESESSVGNRSTPRFSYRIDSLAGSVSMRIARRSGETRFRSLDPIALEIDAR